MSDWSAHQYLKFEDERTRPARDLLAQVPVAEARRVIDIGCGPGNSTELLVRRYPQAAISGIDTSADMLSQARSRLPRCDFAEADIANWTPGDSVDLVFANAAYQWVPDHLSAMRRVVEHLPRGGVLAVQMPDNTREPSHRAMSEIARQMHVSDAAREDLPAADIYYDALSPLCQRVDICHTIYYHVLAGAGAIAEWFRGSALRPFLAPLDATAQQEFLRAYVREIERHYPAQSDGKVLLRFPRLFIVAIRR